MIDCRVWCGLHRLSFVWLFYALILYGLCSNWFYLNWYRLRLRWYFLRLFHRFGFCWLFCRKSHNWLISFWQNLLGRYLNRFFHRLSSVRLFDGRFLFFSCLIYSRIILWFLSLLTSFWHYYWGLIGFVWLFLGLILIFFLKRFTGIWLLLFNQVFRTFLTGHFTLTDVYNWLLWVLLVRSLLLESWIRVDFFRFDFNLTFVSLLLRLFFSFDFYISRRRLAVGKLFFFMG